MRWEAVTWSTGGGGGAVAGRQCRLAARRLLLWSLRLGSLCVQMLCEVHVRLMENRKLSTSDRHLSQCSAVRNLHPMAGESLSTGEAGDRKPSVLSAIIILQWKWNNSGCCVRQEAPVFFTSPVVRLQALSCCFIMKLFSGLCAFKPGRSAYTALLGLKC